MLRSSSGRRLAAAGSCALSALIASVASASAAAALLPGPLSAGLSSDLAQPIGPSAFETQSAPAINGLTARLAALSSRPLRDATDRAQAEALSLRANGAGSLVRDGDDVVVNVTVSETSHALLDELREAGAEILTVNDNYSTIDLAIAPADLRALAAVNEVKIVAEAVEPITSRVAIESAGAVGPGAVASGACLGSLTSEADTQLRAGEARLAFGIDGKGAKVGAISDGFDVSQQTSTEAFQDVGTGDLPGPGNPCGRVNPVQVLQEGQGGIDEGRAMLQLVHDLAPGAALAFASSSTSAEGMANNIRDLAAAGANVIVDDITFFDEPFFQDGPISVAVNEVVGAGIPFFSSAANSNVIVDGANVGSYETPAFRNGGSCIGAGPGVCHDFDPGTLNDQALGIVLNGGRSVRVVLNWAEPRRGVTTNLDLYAFDPAAGTTAASSLENNPATTQKPFEMINLQNPTGSARVYLLIVEKFTGAANPRFKFSYLGGGGVSASEYTESSGGDVIGPTIFGHNGAATAISTAAVPFDNPNVLETFSSYGPVGLYFAPDTGSGPPSAAIAPQILAKPDIAATDNTLTTFFQPVGGGIARFSGTSAAAPHAAAVAALQVDASNNRATVAQIKAAQQATARPVGAVPANGRGAGLIDAVGSTAAVRSPPVATFTKVPKNKVRKESVKYKIASDTQNAQLFCRIDKRSFVACPATAKVKRLPIGKHKFKAFAVAPDGLKGPAIVDKFTRKRGR